MALSKEVPITLEPVFLFASYKDKKKKLAILVLLLSKCIKLKLYISKHYCNLRLRLNEIL